MSCAGTYIHVWSINGSPISSANTFTGRSQQILCCCVSEMNEWDMQNVIVTGHSDGVVRVSTSLKYTLFKNKKKSLLFGRNVLSLLNL